MQILWKLKVQGDWLHNRIKSDTIALKLNISTSHCVFFRLCSWRPAVLWWGHVAWRLQHVSVWRGPGHVYSGHVWLPRVWRGQRLLPAVLWPPDLRPPGHPRPPVLSGPEMGPQLSGVRVPGEWKLEGGELTQSFAISPKSDQITCHTCQEAQK